MIVLSDYSYDHDAYEDLQRNTVQRIWLRVEKGAKNEARANLPRFIIARSRFPGKVRKRPLCVGGR